MNILKEYYDQKSLDYGIGPRRKSKLLEILEGETSGKMILDVGCATGILGGLLKEKNNHIVGIDISSKAIEIAKEVLDQALVLDVENEELPFPKGYFDTIILSEILSHLFLPGRVLLKLRKILKEEGRIVITTPNFLVWTNRIKMLFGKFEYKKGVWIDEGIVRFLTYRSLKKLLEETGFEIVQENHVLHPRTPFKWLGKRLPSLFAFQIVVKVKKTGGLKNIPNELY